MEIVIWKKGKEKVEWKPTRTPKLGWETLTVLEALADSAKVYLQFGNKEMCSKRLNEILKILRKKIEVEKKRSPQTLLKACEYRETKRTRCNKYPTTLNEKTGKYLCKNHFKNYYQKQV